MKLVVSDKKEDLTKYRKGVVVATNKPYLYKNQILGAKVFVESLESDELSPQEMVWEVVREYNEKLAHIDSDFKWIYDAAYQIEGAGLSQATSDIIILTHIFEQIYLKHEIDSVLVFASSKNIMEALVAINFAKIKKVKVEVHYDSIRTYFEALETRSDKFVFSVVAFLKAQVMFGSLLKKSIQKSKPEKKHYLVGICLGSDANKHYNGLCTLVDDVKKNTDQYCMICINSPKSYLRYKEQNINCMDAGAWIDKQLVFKLWKIYNRTCVKYKKWFKNKCWQIENIDISRCINRQICINILWRVQYNIRQAINIGSFFKYADFKFVQGFGDCDTTITRACHYFTSKVGTKLFRAEALQDEGFAGNYVYGNIIDIRYHEQNCPRLKDLEKYGYNGEIVLLPRSAYLYKEKKSVSHSNVNLDKKIKMLWAPSYVLRGYGQKNVFYNDNRLILDGVGIRSEIDLTVKYHPNQDDREVEMFVIQFSKNVHFIDKTVSIQECIQNVDIVVTDTSTLIYNAIEMNKPVIAINSGDIMRKFITATMDYINVYETVEDFFDDWDHYSVDDKTLNEWLDAMLEKQSQFYCYGEDNRSMSSEEMIIKDILARC